MDVLELNMLRQLREMASSFTDEFLAEEGKRGGDITKDEVVIGEVPDAAKRLLVSALELGKRADIAEAMSSMPSTPRNKREDHAKEFRRFRSLAKVAAGLGWLEIIDACKDDAVEVRSGWRVVRAKRVLESTAPGFSTGESLPEGLELLSSIDVTDLVEQLLMQQKDEAERLRNQKPN